MNTGSPHEVPVDVLPPLPKDAYAPATHDVSPPPFANLRSFYHPASGVVILGLDWLTFGSDMLTGFLALPLLCVLAFIITFPVLFVIQSKWSKDTVGPALGKAFLGAFLVALPFPITGTMLGAAVLMLAGLPHHPVDIAKKLVAQGTTSK
jgi:hypothetical protein